MKILIVEDSPQRMRQFRQNLIGAQVAHAATVRQAIELLTKEHFDAVFLDYDLHIHTEHGNPAKTGTGMGAATGLALYYQNRMHTAPLVIIHSLNENGGQAMYDMLRGRHFNVYYHPFAWYEPDLLETLVKEGRWAA